MTRNLREIDMASAINQTELIKLGGLFDNKTDRGNDCMVAQVSTSSRLVVIKNPKQGKDIPPYEIFLAPVEHNPDKDTGW